VPLTYTENVALAVQKTAKQTELPFGLVNGVSPTNHVLNRRTYWRHAANTVEQFCAAAMSGSATRSGDAACSQITSGNLVCFNIIKITEEADGKEP